MINVEDLNEDDIFKPLTSIFNKEENKLFTEKELVELFEDRIWYGLKEVKNKSNSKNLQAHCSAALKNYKRYLILLHIEKIKEIEDLKLTTRAADMFFINYLGRSVGEEFLCDNFGRDFKIGDNIILTPKYKEKLNEIILKYKEECQLNLAFIISMYRKFKKAIVYA